MRYRVLFRQIHLIMTLGAGLWLALSGLTGSLLVFGDHLDRWAHPDLYRVEQSGRSLTLDTILRKVEERTGGEVVRMRLAGRDTPVHELWIDCDRCTRVWVDPSTGAINGVRTHDGTVRLMVHELHRRMLLGDAGERAVGVGGIALVVIVVSGLFLWIPRSWGRAFRLQLSKGWKVATHDLHRMGGIVLAPLLVISAISGIYFVFHEAIDQAFQDWIAPGIIAQNELPSITPSASLDELAHQTEELFPAASSTWITPASAESADVVVRLRQSFEAHPNGRTFIWVDPATGAISKIIDPSLASPVSRLINELYPLHIGRTGGTAHRLLLVLVGLTPSLFLITGLLMWWNRSLRRELSSRWARHSSRERSIPVKLTSS